MEVKAPFFLKVKLTQGTLKLALKKFSSAFNTNKAQSTEFTT